jgi:hypothetical protein
MEYACCIWHKVCSIRRIDLSTYLQYQRRYVQLNIEAWICGAVNTLYRDAVRCSWLWYAVKYSWYIVACDRVRLFVLVGESRKIRIGLHSAVACSVDIVLPGVNLYLHCLCSNGLDPPGRNNNMVWNILWLMCRYITPLPVIKLFLS